MRDVHFGFAVFSRLYPSFVLRRVDDWKYCVWVEFVRLGEKVNGCYIELKKPVSITKAERLFRLSSKVMTENEFFDFIKQNTKEEYIIHYYGKKASS